MPATSPAPVPNDPVETSVDIMMRLLDIDLGAPSVARLATRYVEAVRTCKKCARGQSCRAARAPGFASSLDPAVCPNAELLAELILEALPRPDDGLLH